MRRGVLRENLRRTRLTSAVGCNNVMNNVAQWKRHGYCLNGEGKSEVEYKGIEGVTRLDENTMDAEALKEGVGSK